MTRSLSASWSVLNPVYVSIYGTANDFVKRELLDKLKITHYYWQDNMNGIPQWALSTSMTSQDMIKWGTLLKNNGRWQGVQLISKAFLAQATGSIAKPHSDTYDFSNFSYGYYFWGTKLTVGTKEYGAKLAWGGGGQYVMALDELDMVVAITANIRMGDDKTLEIFEKRILPVFVLLE